MAHCHTFHAAMSEASYYTGAIDIRVAEAGTLRIFTERKEAVLSGYTDRPLPLSRINRITMERLFHTRPSDDSSIYTYNLTLWESKGPLFCLTEEDRYASWDHPRGSPTPEEIWRTAEAIAQSLGLKVERLRFEG